MSGVAFAVFLCPAVNTPNENVPRQGKGHANEAVNRLTYFGSVTRFTECHALQHAVNIMRVLRKSNMREQNFFPLEPAIMSSFPQMLLVWASQTTNLWWLNSHGPHQEASISFSLGPGSSMFGWG
eukprot:EG_transcript_40198